MDKIRVGVIGIGYWGPNLLRNFTSLSNVEVVAVADMMDQRLREVKEAYPHITVTKNYHDFFEMGVQAVAIATPPATHFPIAKDCLEHDVNVMIEKPLALNSDDAEALIHIAEERGLTLMVGHTYEYNSAVRKIKEIIDSGELGKIHYIDSTRLNLGLFQNSLNVMWDLAPHDISILLYLLGEDPLTVTADGNASVYEGLHDIAHIHMKFADNLLAHIHVSWLNPVKDRKMIIIGSEKMLVYDDVSPDVKIKIYDKGVEPQPRLHPNDIRCNYRYGDVTPVHIDWVEPLRAECQHYIDSIINGTAPQSDGWSGLRVVQVLERADRALYGTEEELKSMLPAESVPANKDREVHYS